MALPVADRSSNKNEQIVHAAEVLGRSEQRIAVFTEIYRGKKKTKTVLDLMDVTKLDRRRVLDLGRGLASNELVTQTKDDGITAYEKIDFFTHHRDKILQLARNPTARQKVPTKRNLQGTTARNIALKVDLKVPQRRLKAKHITIDDIDSFSMVKNIEEIPEQYTKIYETRFKAGVAKILRERDRFKDWGGEQSDLSSTKLVLDGKRRAAAFAFKGPGTTGKLTPRKMGKNGDQIQRLFRCPAEIFVVQYWCEIDDSVYEQMKLFAQLKSYFDNKTIWYCVIDGDDSNRLMLAYPSKFPGVVIA